MLPSFDRQCDAATATAGYVVSLQRSCVDLATNGHRPNLLQFFPYLLPNYDDYDCFEDYSERYGCDEHRVNYGCEMFPLAAAGVEVGVEVGGVNAARGIDDVAAVAVVDAAAAGAEIDCWWCRWANCCTVAAHFGRFESYGFWDLMDWNEMEAVRMTMEHEMSIDAAAVADDGGYCIDDDCCCCCCWAHEMASADLYL